MIRQVLLLLEIVMAIMATSMVMMEQCVMVAGLGKMWQMLSFALDRFLLAVVESILAASSLRIRQRRSEELTATASWIRSAQILCFLTNLLALLAVFIRRQRIFLLFDLFVSHHHLVCCAKTGNQRIRLFLLNEKCYKFLITDDEFSYRIVSANLFHASFKPGSNCLFRNFFLDDVFEFFAGKQFLKLQWLSDVHWTVWQHASGGG